MSFNQEKSLILWAIVGLLSLLTLLGQHQTEGAYTYQKLNELMPELRQFLGRTHLGTLRPLSGQPRPSAYSFMDDDQIQFRERKSNNLRNLMRIGKRRMLGLPISNNMNANGLPANDEAAAAAGMAGAPSGAVYYFSPSFPNDNQFQARPIRLPFRLSSFLKI